MDAVELEPFLKESLVIAFRPSVLVVADVSNLYYTIKKQYQGRLDYAKFLNLTELYGRTKQAIAYGASMNNQAGKFIKYLEHRGFETRFKEPKVYHQIDGTQHRKADWDVGIAVDVLGMLNGIDTVVLGTADADMIPLVTKLKEAGKKVIIIGCNIAIDLKKVANHYHEVNESMLEVARIIKG